MQRMIATGVYIKAVPERAVDIPHLTGSLGLHQDLNRGVIPAKNIL